MYFKYIGILPFETTKIVTTKKHSFSVVTILNTEKETSGTIMKVTNAKQFEILVSEMEKYASYALTFELTIKFYYFWKEIEVKLNLLGPPICDRDGER